MKFSLFVFYSSLYLGYYSHIDFLKLSPKYQLGPPISLISQVNLGLQGWIEVLPKWRTDKVSFKVCWSLIVLLDELNSGCGKVFFLINLSSVRNHHSLTEVIWFLFKLKKMTTWESITLFFLKIKIKKT